MSANPADSGYQKLQTEFNNVVDSKIGRGVAVLSALAVPFLTGLCAWLQRKVGIKLDPAELTAFIATMGSGIAITAFKWLSNRGDWERAIVNAYGVYLAGESATKADK